MENEKLGRWIRHSCYGTNTGKKLWEYTCSECKTLGSPQWKLSFGYLLQTFVAYLKGERENEI